MRFENDYIRIIIEKKELTIEKKEELGIKWKRRRPAMVIALLLVIAIIGSVIFNRVQDGKDEVQQAQALHTGTVFSIILTLSSNVG